MRAVQCRRSKLGLDAEGERRDAQIGKVEFVQLRKTEQSGTPAIDGQSGV